MDITHNSLTSIPKEMSALTQITWSSGGMGWNYLDCSAVETWVSGGCGAQDKQHCLWDTAKTARTQRM